MLTSYPYTPYLPLISTRGLTGQHNGDQRQHTALTTASPAEGAPSRRRESPDVSSSSRVLIILTHHRAQDGRAEAGRTRMQDAPRLDERQEDEQEGTQGTGSSRAPPWCQQYPRAYCPLVYGGHKKRREGRARNCRITGACPSRSA